MTEIDAVNSNVPDGTADALREKALELVGGDDVAGRRLLEMIADTNRTTLVALRKDVEAASWDSVGSAAHRIAGSARMLQSDEMIALLTQLEAAARSGDAALITVLLPRLISSLEALEVAIAKALRNGEQVGA